MRQNKITYFTIFDHLQKIEQVYEILIGIYIKVTFMHYKIEEIVKVDNVWNEFHKLWLFKNVGSDFSSPFPSSPVKEYR